MNWGNSADAPLPLRTGLLASALTMALFASAGAAAREPADTSWIRFRTDAARRLFPELPAPRGAHPSAGERPAASVPVSNCNDAGPGSLRDAVVNAVDGDSIDLTQLRCGTITLLTGVIPIPFDSLTVEGPGRDALDIDGADLDRQFLHYGGGTLMLRNLTLSHGHARADDFHVTGGGCVASAGYVALEGTAMRSCKASGIGSYGGAVYAYAVSLANASVISANSALGTHEDADTAAFGGGLFTYQLVLSDSTISGNTALHSTHAGRDYYDVGGGAVAVSGATIVNSTIDSNTSGNRGGGIAAFNPIVISNSTISGNTALTEIGGGLFVRATATLSMSNSTVTRNGAKGGGGIWVNRNSSISSSIVAGNGSGGGGYAADISNENNPNNPAAPLIVSGDHNLIGSAEAGVTLPADTSNADPELASLQNNGGPTRTHALLRGSPALDAGSNPEGLVSDQRGLFPRVYGKAADIGAYEQQAPVIREEAAPVPTLSRWAFALTALLLGGVGLAARARLRVQAGTVRRHTRDPGGNH